MRRNRFREGRDPDARTGLGVVVAGDEVVRELDGVLRVRDLGGVQPGVDVDQGAALVGQGASLGVGEAPGVGEAERDLTVPVQVAQVLGAGDERDVDGSAVRGAADFAQFEAVAGRVEALEVVDRLLEGGEMEVGADLVAEYGLGGGWLGVEGGGGRREGDGGREGVGRGGYSDSHAGDSFARRLAGQRHWSGTWETGRYPLRSEGRNGVLAHTRTADDEPCRRDRAPQGLALTDIWQPYTIYAMKTIKTTVYLNAADYRRLKSLAEEQDRSAAELVREAVAEYAARATERPWPRSIGMGNSGDPDFAENYEDYLDGFGEDGLEDYYGTDRSLASARSHTDRKSSGEEQ